MHTLLGRLAALVLAGLLQEPQGSAGSTPAACRHTGDAGRTQGSLARPGARLHHERLGAGPELLVVHGDVDHRVLHPVLDRAAEFATVTYYDRRGFGGTTVEGEPPADPRAMDLDLDDLEALVDHVAGGRASLLAYSGGGPLAIACALRVPDKVAGLVLLSSYADEDTRVALAQERVQRILADPAVREARAALALVPDLSREERKLREFAILPHVHHALDIDPGIVREWITGGCLEPPVDAPRAPYRGTWARHATLEKGLGQLAAPVLVVYGAQDAITPIELSRALHRAIPGAQMLELEHCGHLAFAEEPERFLQALQTFLDRHQEP